MNQFQFNPNVFEIRFQSELLFTHNIGGVHARSVRIQGKKNQTIRNL